MQTWSWTTRTRTCSLSPHRSLWWGWQTAGLATESSCSSIPRRLGPPMTPCALQARRPEVSPSGTSWTKAGLPRRGRRSPCGWPRDWTSSWVFEKSISRKWKKEEISDSFPKVYLFLLLLLYLLLVLFDYVLKAPQTNTCTQEVVLIILLHWICTYIVFRFWLLNCIHAYKHTYYA